MCPRSLLMTPSAIRQRRYRSRVQANGGYPLGEARGTCCMVCEAAIPLGCTVCGPEHGAILTAQFDTWWANGGPQNVFGRYRHA